jgi:thiamine transport system substrate-binding protein
MDRRTFLRTAGPTTLAATLAGCLVSDGSGGDGSDGSTATDDPGTTASGTETQGTPTATPEPDLEGTLTVATYSAFVDAPSSSPGPWLKEEFESRYPDATLNYVTPENGLNQYIRRRQRGQSVEPDVYVGLNTGQLITVDENLTDSRLFADLDRGRLENAGAVKSSLEIDPRGRAIPYDTGYISLVFDESEVSEPETFEDLASDPYAGTLLAQNAQTSDTGRAFLLWTIHEFGPDRYLDYWNALLDNGVRILDSWDAAYGAYGEGERPMVVSYSTDQVYANRYDQDMTRHQVAFPNDQGYANPETMAIFRDVEKEDLAYRFFDFLLSPTAQGEIAERNVAFPATDHAELSEQYDRYAKEPPQSVTFTYDELRGNIQNWIDEWAREVASN